MMNDAIMVRPPAVRTRAREEMLVEVQTSTRSPTSAGSGYTNPLFKDGDILMDDSDERAEQAVVGHHVVVTPRNPPSPLVAKLRAQSSQEQLRRQDRANSGGSSAGPSGGFSSPNPFFPPTSTASPRATGENGRAHNAPRTSGHSLNQGQSTPFNNEDNEDDDDSLDSIVLDDGPNPVVPATPGRVAQTFARKISRQEEDQTPRADAVAAGAILPGNDKRQERSSAADSTCENPEQVIAPTGCIPAPNPSPGADVMRTSTPQHDKELHAALNDDVRRFVGMPGAFVQPIQCYIVREKAPGGLLKKAPHVYKLYCESPEKFLLSARRRQHTKTTSYVVSVDEHSAQRTSAAYYGKVKSNFIGTDFHIYDNGEREPRRTQRPHRQSSFSLMRRLSTTPTSPPLPRRSSSSDPDAPSADDNPVAPSGGRAELAVVQYHMNVMGTKGPRKMTIGIPYVDFDTNEPALWTAESMLPTLKKAQDERVIKLVNKVPKWNPTLGAYCLNFNGRVTQASVKNFQLVSEGDEQDRDVLQFGRVADNRFTMDFCWPLTAYQAFCICITSLDSKLACE